MHRFYKRASRSLTCPGSKTNPDGIPFAIRRVTSNPCFGIAFPRIADRFIPRTILSPKDLASRNTYHAPISVPATVLVLAAAAAEAGVVSPNFFVGLPGWVGIAGDVRVKGELHNPAFLIGLGCRFRIGKRGFGQRHEIRFLVFLEYLAGCIAFQDPAGEMVGVFHKGVHKFLHILFLEWYGLND